jgi:sugar phosphate isomerase/epimerase
MTIPPISLQLYSLREAAQENFPAVLKDVADMGYVGVEFAGFHGHSPKELRDMLDDLGLVASSIHGPMPTAENKDEIVETAQALGYTRHVTGFGPQQFETKEKTLEAAATVQRAAEVIAGTGVTLGLHNHDFEFLAQFDGAYGHELLMAHAPDVFAEVDTYWVQVGGADVCAVLKKLGARAPLLHIKDGPGDREQAMTAVGQGVMDWQTIMQAKWAGTEWLIVELDRCDTDMREAVAESCRYLVGNGFARGR